MKHMGFIVTLICIFSSMYSQTATPQKSILNNKVTTVSTKDDIVYVTRTGKKYHRANCPSLRKSMISMKRSEAEARGYMPCQICKP